MPIEHIGKSNSLRRPNERLARQKKSAEPPNSAPTKTGEYSRERITNWSTGGKLVCFGSFLVEPDGIRFARWPVSVLHHIRLGHRSIRFDLIKFRKALEKYEVEEVA